MPIHGYSQVATFSVSTHATTTAVTIATFTKHPLRWCTLRVDTNSARIEFNGDAAGNSIKLFSGESYTSPENVRIHKISSRKADAGTGGTYSVFGQGWR